MESVGTKSGGWQLTRQGRQREDAQCRNAVAVFSVFSPLPAAAGSEGGFIVGIIIGHGQICFSFSSGRAISALQ